MPKQYIIDARVAEKIKKAKMVLHEYGYSVHFRYNDQIRDLCNRADFKDSKAYAALCDRELELGQFYIELLKIVEG